MFDHSYDRCPAIIKKNMMVVAAEKHTCFYCTTYVMRKQFGFFWQAMLSQGMQTI